MGPRGAGHYVKMVHNGIEYGDMQLIAEVYDLLHRGAGLPPRELADIFAEWNDGELRSYLVEITARIFERIDEETGKPLVDVILDEAQQKGTGKWMSQNAFDIGAPIPTVNAAVEARILSSLKTERVAASRVLRGPSPDGRGDRARLIDAARQALYASKITSYAQGMAMLRMASKEYGYGIDPGTGRQDLAGRLHHPREPARRHPAAPSSAIPASSTCCSTTRSATRSASARTAGGTSCRRRSGSAFRCRRWARRSPTTTRTARARLPANLTQAQRDFFGAHTYRRVDRDGVFHTDWTGDGAATRGATHTDDRRSTGSKIPAEGALDFLALGALIHRLDPGRDSVPQGDAPARFTSAAASSTPPPTWPTASACAPASPRAMVEYPIGELIAGRVRAMGVTPFYKMFKHDGVRGPNMATVYSDRGFGVRGPIVFYNRCNEAAAQLKPGDFDWEKIFGAGVRWFHSGGIFASLSETTSELIIEGMEAAHRHGAVVSLDLNYREKLWAAAGGADRAVATLGRIVEHVDVLVGNEEDLQKGLGIAGPEVTAKAASALDHSAFSGMIENVVKRFPRIKVVATTLRARALDQPPLVERGRVDQRRDCTSRRPASSTSTTASAAATASPPVCSTAC